MKKQKLESIVTVKRNVNRIVFNEHFIKEIYER